LALYGEVYGTQDLKYGCKPGQTQFAAFDVYDTTQAQWLDHQQFRDFCQTLEIPMVPELYRGEYLPGVIEPLAEGKSTIAGHIREGFVIKPLINRIHYAVGGRVILKLVSEAYLLRKDGSEWH
jgi:RNA ligase (TIGR02306 family)